MGDQILTHNGNLVLGVVGAGYWGSNLIRTFCHHPKVHLSTVCDIDETNRKKIESRYPELRVTPDINEILSDCQVGAVVISTPTETHYSITKQCLESNKHVFVEKPLSTSSFECQELISLSARNCRKLMVGHIFIYNPAVQYVHQLIQSGELGNVIYISCKRVNLGPVRNDVSVLWDLGPHDISICNYWLKCEALSGRATGLNFLNCHREDVVFASLKYPTQTLVNLHLSWLDPKKVRQISVIGTKRAVWFDDLDPVGAIQICDKRFSREMLAQSSDSIQAYKSHLQGGDLVVPKLPVVEPLARECEAFVDWVLKDKRIDADGISGWEVVKALEALSQSLNSHGIETPLEHPYRREGTPIHASAGLSTAPPKES